jgi:hypothetical protein
MLRWRSRSIYHPAIQKRYHSSEIARVLVRLNHIPDKLPNIARV